MADSERGTRIKERRDELGLTQPEVVEAIERLADALPVTHRLHPTHPKAKGRYPVTLRGYQSWEAGGGIDPAKAKLLAEALETDTKTLINGFESNEPTPSPFAGQDTLADKLDLILENQRLMLTRLDDLERAITEGTLPVNDETAERILRLGREVVEGPARQADASDPQPARERRRVARS